MKYIFYSEFYCFETEGLAATPSCFCSSFICSSFLFLERARAVAGVFGTTQEEYSLDIMLTQTDQN